MIPAITTVNGDYYSSALQVQLHRAIWDKCQELYRSGFILHQVNAQVHVSRVVQLTMSDLNKEPLQHLFYSPEFAICDFCMFPTVKDHFHGKKIKFRVKLGTVIMEVLWKVLHNTLKHLFCMWVERWDKCIEVKGSCFEKE